MAKNWTMKEALEAIKNNDKAGIADLGKRFPNVAVALAKIGDNEGAETIINGLPEHVTARKVEAQLKGDVDDVEDVDVDDTADADDVEEEATEKKSTRGRKKKTSDEDKKAAARERARKRREAKKAAEAAEDEDDEFEDEADETEEEDPYAGKNAVELFKLCKKRGITAQPKKKAADYIKLLKKADEAEVSNDSDDEDEDDEWDI